MNKKPKNRKSLYIGLIAIFIMILHLGYVYVRLGSIDNNLQSAVLKMFSNEFPLKFAAHNGNNTIIKFLLDHGSDIHVQEDQPLISAVLENHLHTVKLLVERGANIHAQNDFPLWIAAQNGNYEIAKFLLDHGANVAGCHGAIKVGIAKKNGHEDVANLIAEYMKQFPEECRPPTK